MHIQVVLSTTGMPLGCPLGTLAPPRLGALGGLCALAPRDVGARRLGLLR